ncbi:MAG: hypothetical protein LBM73_01715 [Candidatus Nomurabacteria bacterium]|nr:hypothetical protein [Candidatus Nomurabacteria bacterium]
MSIEEVDINDTERVRQLDNTMPASAARAAIESITGHTVEPCTSYYDVPPATKTFHSRLSKFVDDLRQRGVSSSDTDGERVCFDRYLRFGIGSTPELFISVDEGRNPDDANIYVYIATPVVDDGGVGVTYLNPYNYYIGGDGVVYCERSWGFTYSDNDSRNGFCVRGRREVGQSEVNELFNLIDSNVSDREDSTYFYEYLERLQKIRQHS